MKKILLFAVFCGGVYFSQAQLKTPNPSVAQTIKQEFALTNIELSYSRPSMKGRRIMGDLVPYGAVWRTGANNATTISFADDVIIGGKTVPAGKYGLLSIPGASEWTIIISKQTNVTSPAAYKQDQDVVRVTAAANQLPFPIETFMFLFENVTSNSIDLMMAWENTVVSFPIRMEVDSKVMAQIDQAMKGDKPPYFQAAMYYLQNGKDVAKAADWLDKATKADPNAFWVWHQKASALAKLGKKAEAIAAAKKSIELAKAAQNNDYVELNNKLLATLN